MIRSPGLLSDLAVHRHHGSTIEQRDGYLVVRTPADPTYHWGNCLILESAPAPGSLDAADAALDADEAAALGVTLERSTVLAGALVERAAAYAGDDLGAALLVIVDPDDDAIRL